MNVDVDSVWIDEELFCWIFDNLVFNVVVYGVLGRFINVYIY